MKKTISIILSIMVAATMSFAFGTVSYGVTEELSVTVIDNTATPAVEITFNDEELTEMIESGFMFSAVNNFGSPRFETGLRGIKVSGILKKAGASIDPGEKIVFKDPGGSPRTFYYDEYTVARYYYPMMGVKSVADTLTKGPINEAKATKDKKKVMPVIVITGKENPVTKLYFGQSYPGDRNMPKFWDDIATGGSIEIEKAESKVQCSALGQPTVESGSEVTLGTKINFRDSLPVDTFVYYTTDGKTPTLYSSVYNCNPYQESGVKTEEELFELRNPIVLNKAGNITVKTVVRAFNKTDSQVSSFKYNVKPADPVVKLTSGKKLFKLKITNNTGTSKYTVKYKAKGKAWKTVTMSGTSKTIKKVAKGPCQVTVQAVAGTMKSEVVSGTVKVK